MRLGFYGRTSVGRGFGVNGKAACQNGQTDVHDDPNGRFYVEDGCERARMAELILESRRVTIRDLSAALGLPPELHTTGP